MVYLTRKAEFSASHYYDNPEMSPEENQRIFGKCNNPNGHGHNYTLEVTVKGNVDPRSGFVVDLKQLKDVMNREVLDAMDHRFLNKEVPEFSTRIPTTENLAIAIWERLAPKLKAAQLLTCSSMSTENHESAPHASLHVLGFASPAQRRDVGRREQPDLRQMQQPARTRSQLHGRGNSERRSRPEHGDGVQSG